jgi:beta-glucanase (GH16 family)
MTSRLRENNLTNTSEKVLLRNNTAVKIGNVSGDTWITTASGQAGVNGSADTITANAIDAVVRASSTLPTPSANGTAIHAGSTGAITDAAGNRWTLSTTNAVLENGTTAGFSANVAEIVYANGTVWQENTGNQWYSWTGSTWVAGGDPLSVSGSTGGGSYALGSELNLTGYHLTFDWEANSFPNSPTPQDGSFTTTLSSGLRYLSNGDQEYWADSSTGQGPFLIDSGSLNINATYVGAGNTPGGGNLSYVSGVFTTQGWFSQQYGYFEMRAELPAGAGMWPAFWMLDNNSDQPGGWPPELDALETFGAPNADGEGGTNQVHWDVHSQNASQQGGGWVTLNGNETTGYHTYGVLWTPTTMSFVYDGKIEAQTPTPSDYTQAMYMIVDLAVGGTWPGDATGENGTLKIDYLRAFSSNSAIPAVTLQAISSPDGGGTSLYGATTATSADASSTLGSSQTHPIAIMH